MKYIVCSEFIKGITPYDMTVLETDDLAEAIYAADTDWFTCSEKERRERKVYVIASSNPDRDAEDHYDGDYAAYYSYELFNRIKYRHCDVVMWGADEYACIEQAYPINNGEGVRYVAKAIRKGDGVIDGEINTYTIEWEADMEAEDEEDVCDWGNPVSVKPSRTVSEQEIR